LHPPVNGVVFLYAGQPAPHGGTDYPRNLIWSSGQANFALFSARDDDKKGALMNTLDMKGRAAVVTGGAAGIGFAIAQRLASSGAKVALWDRDAKALTEASNALGGPVHIEALDVADEAAVTQALASSAKALGRIDALVCSAGITGPNLPVKDYPVADWKQVLDINLTGVFLCNKALTPHMTANDYGRIVNIASIAGKEGNPNASAYSASKAGVIALTKSLGKELAKTGVRVNCVTPAAVKTGMFSQMTPQHIDFMLSKIPMGRFGDVEEIAALVAWLCTEECSFSTGAVFDLSGGRAVY
jgi:2-dehydro-3-deoxy-L-rhamnonate dehydrogenase (NAD+)